MMGSSCSAELVMSAINAEVVFYSFLCLLKEVLKLGRMCVENVFESAEIFDCVTINAESVIFIACCICL